MPTPSPVTGPASRLGLAFLQPTLEVGGAETLIQTVIRGLDRERFRVALLEMKGSGRLARELARDGVPVHAELARGRLDPGAGARLRDACRSESVRVLYVTDSALAGFWAGWLRRREPGLRLVMGFHSTANQRSTLAHRLAGRMTLPVTDRFVALAPGHRDHLVTALGLDPTRVVVIPNGVDTTRFHPADDRAAAKRALGWSGDDTHVTIVAALRPEKDHARFLRAAVALAPRHPAARFLIVGDGPERARLEATAAASGLGDRVRFLGLRADTPAIQRASDVVTLCSRPVVETFPLSLLEALASGTPVVSTRVGSIADLVRDGETGLLCDANDEAGYVAALDRLLADATLGARLGAAGRADVLARYRREDMIAEYERLFAELATGT